MGHSTEEAFPLHISLFERKFILPGSAPQTFPWGSLVRARARAPRTLIIAKEAGMTMAGFHPSRPIPRAQGPGAMDLNTPSGEKKETASNSKAFHSIPGHDCWYPMRPGVGFLRAGVLSPHQSEIPRHQCFFQTRNPGRTGAVFPPRSPIKIHRQLTNIHSVYLL